MRRPPSRPIIEFADIVSPVRGWAKAAVFVAAVALALIAVQSGRMGIAGLFVDLAQSEVDAWASAREPQGLSALNRVAEGYVDSFDYVSDNPWALEGLGAMDLARVRLSRVPEEALAYAKDAQIRFREALRQRPTSPYLWANLALAKLYTDEIDASFFTAIRHADELGPWEPNTQQAVLFLWLAVWDKLDAGSRHSVAQVVERGGVHNALKVFEIVKIYRRFDLVCGLSSYDALVGAECRKAAEAAGAEAPKSRGRR
jgi:hypothetical protein